MEIGLSPHRRTERRHLAEIIRSPSDLLRSSSCLLLLLNGTGAGSLRSASRRHPSAGRDRATVLSVVTNRSRTAERAPRFQTATMRISTFSPLSGVNVTPGRRSSHFETSVLHF